MRMPPGRFKRPRMRLPYFQGLDSSGLTSASYFRRRARNAADQVNERRAGYGRDLAGQREAAPGIVVSVHHRAPQTESAK